MDVDQNDFAAAVSETTSRARAELRGFEHPIDLDRRIDAALASARGNSHALSIESHPAETARNRAGQIARRLALNPADQRRLNRELVELFGDLEQRTRRHETEIAELKAQVDRLLALRRSAEAP